MNKRNKILIISSMISLTLIFIIGLVFFALCNSNNRIVEKQDSNNDTDNKVPVTVADEEVVEKVDSPDLVINNLSPTDEYLNNLPFEITEIHEEISPYIKDMEEFKKSLQKFIYSSGYSATEAKCYNELSINFEQKCVNLYFTLNDERNTTVAATIYQETKECKFAIAYIE